MDHEKRFVGVDGLRGVFCLGIVMYHMNQPFESAFLACFGPVYKYGGYFGNYLFFICSGLLISFHYKKRIIKGGCSFRSFMAKRILKLYPIYFWSNLFAMFLGTGNWTMKRTAGTFLLIENGWFSGESMPYNYPTWFICVLLLCYIVYFFVSTVSRSHPNLYLPFCVMFMIWGMILEKKAWEIPFQYRTCGEGYMNFFLGVLLAELLMKENVRKKRLLTVSGLSVCLIAAAAYWFGLEKIPGDMRWGISILCAGLIGMAVYGKWLVKILACPFLQIIGKYSISIYFWHVPAIRAFLRMEGKAGLLTADPRLKFALYFLLLSLFAGVSYHFFEKNSSKGGAVG